MKKTLANIDALLPHEHTDNENFRKIFCEIAKANAVFPIIADERTLVVLDGHHRLESLKKLKAKRAPVILVDYFSEDVKVEQWRRDVPVSKEEVIRRGLKGELFLPKTSKHTHHFRTDTPVELNILL